MMVAALRPEPVKPHKPVHWKMDAETDFVVNQVANKLYFIKSNKTKYITPKYLFLR